MDTDEGDGTQEQRREIRPFSMEEEEGTVWEFFVLQEEGADYVGIGGVEEEL